MTRRLADDPLAIAAPIGEGVALGANTEKVERLNGALIEFPVAFLVADNVVFFVALDLEINVFDVEYRIVACVRIEGLKPACRPSDRL